MSAAPGFAADALAPGFAADAPGFAADAPGFAENAPGFAEKAPGFAADAPASASPAAAKRSLRRIFRLRRAATSPEARRHTEDAALQWLRSTLAASPSISAVATYFSVGDEFPTSSLIAECLSQGRIVCLPRWNAATGLYEWAEFKQGAPLRNGPMDIPEPAATRTVLPAEIDLYLAPGLAFDRSGTRIGYGGGWFDRLLAQAAPDAKIFGLCYPTQISAETLPRQPHDIPVFPLPPLLP